MPEPYTIMLDAELSKAFDVWSGYLDARTEEDPRARAELRATLESARAAAAEGDDETARARVEQLYDDAGEAGLRWAPARPRPREADLQARDYVKDALPQVLPPRVRERLFEIGLFLSVTGRRLRCAPGLDEATREDVLYVTARAELALDLVQLSAAQRELDRLKEIARRVGVED